MTFNTQLSMKTVSNELIRIKDIEISNRFRNDVGDISELAFSIKNNDLIHPISITKDGKLVALKELAKLQRDYLELLSEEYSKRVQMLHRYAHYVFLGFT